MEMSAMKTTSDSSNPGWIKTNLLNRVSLLLLILAFAGCSEAKNDKIVIRGSNTIGEELAPRLIADFQKDHSGVTFDLEFKGTPYGMGALMAGCCDIAAASRDASLNELALARSRGMELNDYIIGSYSVAVIVNGGNPVSNLTRDQVRDIFTGTIQNWKEVGGPDAPIQLYVRDPISGTHVGFRELAMENKPYADGMKAFTNYTGIIQAVAKDPGGIGYSSVFVGQQPGVKLVSIGGVAPSVFSVNSGQYPYCRALRFYTDKTNETVLARDFIQYVQGSRGQDILKETGFVAHK